MATDIATDGGDPNAGRLTPPDLDDRRFDDLVAEIREIARRKLPEWTDLGPSDPGMVVAEMVAWLVETLIYRLNKVTDRNYVEFLNLIGVVRRPAVPATTFLTFQAAPDLAASLIVPAGTQVGTLPTESRSSQIFETDEDIKVTPLNLVEAYLGPLTSPQPVTTNLVQAPLNGLPVNLKTGQPFSLVLGFDGKAPAPDVLQSFTVRVGIGAVPIEGNGRPVAAKPATITASFATSTAQNTAGFSSITPTANLPALTDATNGLLNQGDWTFANPGAAWTALPRWQWMGPLPENERDKDGQGNNVKRLWIKFDVTPQDDRGLILEHILTNSGSATNALTFNAQANARPDLIGNGSTNQFIELAHRPLYERPSTDRPFDHLRVEVADGGTREPWALVDDFPGDPTAKVYRLEPATGVIEFGDGERGLAPRVDSQVFVTRYRYVAGGRSGNVPPGTLIVPQRPLPSGVTRAFNPGPGRYGVDPEPIEEAKQRGPELLRNRSRAVTQDDYEGLALKASTRVRRARCLAPLEGAAAEPFFGRLDRGPGRVNVVIVPDDPGSPRPTPSPDLLLEVQRELGRQTVITTGLTVTGPRFVPVLVSMNVQLFNARDGSTPTRSVKDRLQADLDAAVRRFLHPLNGGPPGASTGWPIGRHCFASELYDSIKDLIGGAGFVTQFEVRTSVPKRQVVVAGATNLAPGWIDLPSNVGVGVADYELICSVDEKHEIRVP